ncbi:MAG: thioredoxin family protein [Bacteroidia bacterium]|nr:thioredoxin family protein [Bacteroidia bacterium]
MAATSTIHIHAGTEAPPFRLPDVVTGAICSLDSLRGPKGTLVIFMCNHCPYVLHILNKLVSDAAGYRAAGISVVAISSNDVVKYPQDSPERMKELALEKNFGFPYLYDATQDVAKAYFAACTPDLFLLDADLRYFYRGRFDQSNHKNNLAPTGEDLREAVNALLGGGAPPADERPSLGCNIKWKDDIYPYGL